MRKLCTRKEEFEDLDSDSSGGPDHPSLLAHSNSE